MSEMYGWTMIVSWAVVAAAVSMLSWRVEQETRTAFEAGLRKAMARLQGQFRRQSGRTSAGRINALRRSGARKRPVFLERRAYARRRLEDLFPSLKQRRSTI